MALKYSWFKIDKDEKFESHNFEQQEITEPKLKYVFGLYLFDLKNKAELDIVPARLKDIKSRTIGDYTDIDINNPPDSVWSDDHTTELLSKIDNARRSLLETDLDDAIKNYTGAKHKVNVGGIEQEILETLYLDVDEKSWDVEDIVNEELHEMFYRPVFTTKDEKLNKKQLMLLNPIEVENKQDYKRLVKLDLDDWQKVIDSNINMSKFINIIKNKKGNKITLTLNIDFSNSDAQINAVKKIFPGQKVKFMPSREEIKSASTVAQIRMPIQDTGSAKGDYKRELADSDEIKNYNYHALEDAVDLNEDEEGLKNVLMALNELSKESQIQEALPPLKTTTVDTTYGDMLVQGVPFDAEDYIDGLEVEISDEDSGEILETVFGTLEELKKDPRFESVLSKYETSKRKADRYIDKLKKDAKTIRDNLVKTKKKRQEINFTGTSNVALKEMFQSESQESLKDITSNWIKTINSDGSLYRLFQQILLPMSVTSQGDYKIVIQLNKKGLDYTGQVKKWEYVQSAELDTKFLSMPSGRQSRVKLDIGRKNEKGKTKSMQGDYRTDMGSGYNPVRQFLTKFVTNRLSKLDEAIESLRRN